MPLRHEGEEEKEARNTRGGGRRGPFRGGGVDRGGGGRGQGRVHGYGERDAYRGRGRGGRGRAAAIEPNYQREESSLNAQVLSYWQRLVNCHRNNSSNFHNGGDEDRRLWLECWTAVASGQSRLSPPIVLPALLLKLPATNAYLPPTSLLVQVLNQVLLHANAEAKNSVKSVIEALDCVAASVQERLSGQVLYSGSNKSFLIETMTKIQRNYEERALQSMTGARVTPSEKELLRNHLVRIRIIGNYIEELSTVSLEGFAEPDIPSAIVQEKPWVGWIHSPTVGWLMAANFLVFPELTNVYENAEAYADTLERMWTALTFYWGAGAVFPRCSHTQGGQEADERSRCNEPLISRANSPGVLCSMKLSSGFCGQQAVWKCYKNRHDAICAR